MNPLDVGLAVLAHAGAAVVKPKDDPQADEVGRALRAQLDAPPTPPTSAPVHAGEAAVLDATGRALMASIGIGVQAPEPSNPAPTDAPDLAQLEALEADPAYRAKKRADYLAHKREREADKEYLAGLELQRAQLGALQAKLDVMLGGSGGTKTKDKGKKSKKGKKKR